jgi:LDH2 family malate/lactate/ureidoglycolate dehydrogenase
MSIRVDYKKIQEYLTEIFMKKGLSKINAAIVAENLVMAESRGVRSHGLVQVKNYVTMYENGIYNPEPEIKVEKDSGSILLLDGDNGPGAVVGKYAMKRTIEKAKESGIAMTAVKNCTHFGMAEYFAIDAVENNMIGLAFTNVRVPLVAPFGGYSKQLGTNPICVAVPATNHAPIIFDAATSEAAFNKVVYARAEGKRIPDNWAVNGKGQPTTDPEEVISEGALVPFGGYKGYGLAFIVNIITGLLSGACLSKDEAGNVTENESGVGFNFIAVDIEKFLSVNDFKDLVDEFIIRIKNSPRINEDEPILVPGEPEHEKEILAIKQGIEIFNGVESELKFLGEKLQTDMRLENCIVS